MLGCIAVAVTLLVGFRPANHRKLTPAEEKCVGSWSFKELGHPSTLFVYHFSNDGRAVEEHYYLTSATPTKPRLKMYGVWHVERDGRLVVEPAPGATGAMVEASRMIKNLGGNNEYDFPILRRFYKIVSITPSELKFLVSRKQENGKYGPAELSMTPFTGVPVVKPKPSSLPLE